MGTNCRPWHIPQGMLEYYAYLALSVKVWLGMVLAIPTFTSFLQVCNTSTNEARYKTGSDHVFCCGNPAVIGHVVEQDMIKTSWWQLWGRYLKRILKKGKKIKVEQQDWHYKVHLLHMSITTKLIHPGLYSVDHMCY